MSVKIMGLVWDSDLPRNEKAILLAYADHADHEGGNVYPSVGRIAWKTGYKEREVQKITRQLESKGILAKQGKGPNGTNLFRIVLALLPSRPEYEGCKKHTPIDPPLMSKNAPPDVEKCTPPLLQNAPESSVNHPIQPSFKKREPMRPPKSPTCQILVEETGKSYLTTAQLKQTDKAVGNDPAALDRWRETVKAWHLNGNNPRNAAGMLDWFNSGKRSNYEPKSTNKGKEAYTRAKPTPKDNRLDFEKRNGQGYTAEEWAAMLRP